MRQDVELLGSTWFLRGTYLTNWMRRNLGFTQMIWSLILRSLTRSRECRGADLHDTVGHIWETASRFLSCERYLTAFAMIQKVFANVYEEEVSQLGPSFRQKVIGTSKKIRPQKPGMRHVYLKTIWGSWGRYQHIKSQNLAPTTNKSVKISIPCQ